MNDQEFVSHVVNYVHRYFRDDFLLLEIIAEAVEDALAIKKSITEEKNETTAA